MKPSAVLTAAAALHEFSLGQVSAYCNGDRREVQEVLDSFGRFFDDAGRPAGADEERRWRVADMAALRAEIARDLPADGQGAVGGRDIRQPSQPVLSGRSLRSRLLLAEETLVDCGSQPSAAHRRVMARTVMNYLQQVVVAARPGRCRPAGT